MEHESGRHAGVRNHAGSRRRTERHVQLRRSAGHGGRWPGADRFVSWRGSLPRRQGAARGHRVELHRAGCRPVPAEGDIDRQMIRSTHSIRSDVHGHANGPRRATCSGQLSRMSRPARAPRSPQHSLRVTEGRRILARLGRGRHTLTHPDLASCSAKDARAAIAGGADRLRARLGVEAEQFAYPFWHVDPDRRPPGRRARLPRRLHD
jgi:hypothetical protein